MLLSAALVSAGASAEDASRLASFALSPDSRLRCLDQEARHVVETALAVSPTVVRMVAELQSTDLIVGVETMLLPARASRGDTTIILAAPGARHVRIRIGIPASQSDLVSVLGHELQHALEIAAAPDVRDAATLRSHYKEIGYTRSRAENFETDAALRAERQVSLEVAAYKAVRPAGGR
jgi:hypothetical protein